MFWNAIKKPLVIVSFAAILAILSTWYYLGDGDDKKYEFASASRGDVVREVSVTGRVQPSESVDLAFEKSGRVSFVNFDVGDEVFSGQVIVSLENGDIRAQLLQAEAGVEAEEAKLSEFLRGTREEEVNIQRTKVSNAEKSLEDARQTVLNDINDAYTKSDDAIRNKVDQFINNPRSSNPQLSFVLSDSQLEIDIEQKRAEVEVILSSWGNSLDLLTIESDLDSRIFEAKTNLSQIKSFLDRTATAVNSLTENSSLSQTTIDGYKSDISTARTDINKAISNVSSADESFRSAESSLSLSKKELDLKLAGRTLEEINEQKAKAKEAKANADRYSAELIKTIIRAPISGVITKQEAKVGEIVSSGVVVVFLISKSDFEIEANVPEVDIARLNIGDNAEVTLDAYGSDVVFEASVVKIDPAETIVEGVATYTTTLQFSKKDERIKSGMTANIDILSDKKENVIVIPQRAVLFENGNKTVRVLSDDGTLIKKPVETGLEGSDGTVEIISGVEEGENVVTFVRE